VDQERRKSQIPLDHRDDVGAHSLAWLGGKARRLVNDEYVFVFVQ
jgi:hypothetical protein